LDVCHQMVLTPELADEWRRHQSKYTRIWRTEMYARKKVRSLGTAENEDLRRRALDPAIGAQLLAVRKKDVLLIEAALLADHIVISLDETARDAFSLRELRVITWANPIRDRERMPSWLEAGAPAVEEWTLGRTD
jgi:hypothetical protein